MKAIVVYRSKTGFTKTYAEWIAAELGCDIKENKKLSPEELAGYDVIIYGGGMYAGGIAGLDLIKKNYNMLKHRHIIIWATGSSVGREEELDEVWKKNFTQEQLKHIRTFYLRGGFNYQRLSAGNKVLMSMFKAMIKRDSNPSEDMQGMLQACDVPVDFRDKKNIEPMISYVRGLTGC